MARAEAVEEISVREIEASLGSETIADVVDTDPFAAKGVELRKMMPTAAMKRRASRLEKAYTGTDDAKTHGTEINAFTAYDAFDLVVPPYNMDYLARLYEISSPHYSACNAKTSNIVGLGYSWQETQKTKDILEDVASDEDKTRKARKKLGKYRAELDAWLEDTNFEDTFIEVLQKVWTDYETTGNGFVEVGRTPNGQIGYIGHISAATMRVRRKRDGYVQVVGNIATFFRNFGDTKTEDPLRGGSDNNEIIHIKKYTPTQTFYGIPDIIAAKTALAGDEFAARFNLDYFEHKAVPRYVIVSKGAELTARSEKRIHEFFLSNLKGKNHRTLYIPLPADSENSKVAFEIKPVEAGIQDASFINYRHLNRDEILMAHRVPITKVSIGDDVPLAAARDADKTFKETVARPEQDRLEKRINRIIAEKTDMFILKLNEMTLTDEDTQSSIDERNQRNGIETINEIRARHGRGPVEWGNQPLAMTAAQQAEETAQANQSRERDAERSANATDSRGEGRNEQGAGRSAQ